MKHLVLGITILLFGIFIGGIGVASAGIGIGIPMIPLGIYLSYRGWRIYKHEEDFKRTGVGKSKPLEPLEKTSRGKIGIGILLILIGAGTSAMLIGIPIFIAGVWFLYQAFKAPIKNAFNK